MKITEVLRTASIMLALAASQLAVAEEKAKEAELETVVVTASRTEESAKTVGSSITVITNKDIESSNAPSALELLRLVPGITVAQSGGPGTNASIFLRGGESNYTLILIDGIRANSNTDGSFNFGTLSTDNIERIEILRGSQSAVYGSDAISGVINIITKKGEDAFGGSFRIEGGNHDTFGSALSIHGSINRLKYRTSVDRYQSAGWSAAWDPSSKKEKDKHERWTISQNISYNYADNGFAELIYRHENSEQDIDAGAANDGPGLFSDSQSHYAGFNLTQSINEFWNQGVSLSGHTDKLLGNGYEIKSLTRTFDTRSTLPFTAYYSVIFGYTYEDRKGESENTYEKQYHLHSGYLENKFNIAETLFINLGGRYDDFDELGNKDTYRASLAYLINSSNTRIHTSYGTGFKMPSLVDLLYPAYSFTFFGTTYTGSGNPNLKPEQSETFDIGIEQAFIEEKVKLNVTYFYNEFIDLIDWQTTILPGPIQNSTPTNLDKAVTQGVESGMSIQFSKLLGLQLGHTYTDTENKANGQRLARRPLNQYTVGIGFDYLKVSGSLSMVAVRDRVDTSDNDMDDYERWDLSVNYQVTENIRPFLRIQNLFDANYEEVTGFTSPGINGTVGLLVTF